MYGWPDEPFEEMDSTLAVQQVLKYVLKNCMLDQTRMKVDNRVSFLFSTFNNRSEQISQI